jgi:Skp family chaperone for outer membrane proteins
MVALLFFNSREDNPMNPENHFLRMAVLILVVMTLLSTKNTSAAEQKFAVVNVEKVLKKSQSIQLVIQKAQQKVGQKEKSIEEKINEYDRARTRLKTRKTVMNKKEIGEEESRLENLREEISDLQHEVNKEMTRIQREIMDPEVDRIYKAVETVGRNESYSLIVRSESVLFYNPESDITSRIIRELDREYLKEHEKPRFP